MAEPKIRTEFICQNIVPIEHLNKEINSSSLKFGVFANNGSGKTFISRMFRLTENSDEVLLNNEGNILNDSKSYTLINDLSHGVWRTEQKPLTNEDYKKEVCELIVKHMEGKLIGHITYCKSTC